MAKKKKNKKKLGKIVSHHHGKHHIKLHCWENGVLQTIERECRTLEHAIEIIEDLFLDILSEDIHACKIHRIWRIGVGIRPFLR